jgi:hypothetical protein
MSCITEFQIILNEAVVMYIQSYLTNCLRSFAYSFVSYLTMPSILLLILILLPRRYSPGWALKE